VAGLAAFCATYLLGLLLATRGVTPARKRRALAVYFCAETGVIVGLFAWTALIPMDDPRLPPAPLEDQRFWDLPTGSRIAHVRVAVEGRPGRRRWSSSTAAPECLI
jgi:proline iminopeptidase